MQADETRAGFCSAGTGEGGIAAAERFCRSLNPCAKLLSLLCFLTCTVSFGKYDVSGLVPLLALPFLGGRAFGRAARGCFSAFAARVDSRRVCGRGESVSRQAVRFGNIFAADFGRHNLACGSAFEDVSVRVGGNDFRPLYPDKRHFGGVGQIQNSVRNSRAVDDDRALPRDNRGRSPQGCARLSAALARFEVCGIPPLPARHNLAYAAEHRQGGVCLQGDEVQGLRRAGIPLEIIAC